VTALDAEVSKPLSVGELIASAIRIFGARPYEFLGLGVVLAATYFLATAIPFVAGLALLAGTFAFALGICVRLITGDSVPAALERMLNVAPSLVALAIVVAVPFYIGSTWLVLLVLSVAWLALTAFAIPVAVLEEPDEDAFGARVAHALRRTVTLARVEYLHAVGVVGALVIIYVLIGIVLALALFSFADNGQYAALALSQIVLAPFFFIGLAVLYFEQDARMRRLTGRFSERE
jgi:hypothetical protein